MNKSRILLVVLAALMAGAWWSFQSNGPRRTQAPPAPLATIEPGVDSPDPSEPSSDPRRSGPPDDVRVRPDLRPPDPARRFIDFTPEQRVEFARRGHGPGG